MLNESNSIKDSLFSKNLSSLLAGSENRAPSARVLCSSKGATNKNSKLRKGASNSKWSKASKNDAFPYTNTLKKTFETVRCKSALDLRNAAANLKRRNAAGQGGNRIASGAKTARDRSGARCAGESIGQERESREASQLDRHLRKTLEFSKPSNSSAISSKPSRINSAEKKKVRLRDSLERGFLGSVVATLAGPEKSPFRTNYASQAAPLFGSKEGASRIITALGKNARERKAVVHQKREERAHHYNTLANSRGGGGGSSARAGRSGGTGNNGYSLLKRAVSRSDSRNRTKGGDFTSTAGASGRGTELRNLKYAQ